MKKNFFYLFILMCFILFSCNNINKKREINILPKPLLIEQKSGDFHLNKNIKIAFNGDEKILEIIKYFNNSIDSLTGYKLKYEKIISENSRKKHILFKIIKDNFLGKEGYYLNVDKHTIKITANDYAGLFYGVQSLLQLMPPEKKFKNEIPIPCVKIKDKPVYSWRGMHLDVSRHFFPKEFIKKYIDIIAMHKMNIFHWHLTDDNGWRIEIKKYPKLTDICAWRVNRESEPWNERTPPRKGEKATYGGYYTQEDIKEIVKYAEDRFVEIIPEIEMPGHSSEIFAAYPEYSCTGKKTYVKPGGYWPNSDIFCAGNDKTFDFIEDILSEVIQLFPSKYIHIGGDEADKTQWEKCKKCQTRIKKLHLKDENELQSYFIKRIEKFLISKNKKLIGWDEILEGGLAPEATVMSWRGMHGGIAAAKKNHDVIMCPGTYCYFDHYQADPEFQPIAIGGFLTLKKVYSFDPTPKSLNNEEKKHILGAQGNVWTEYIPNPKKVEYMAVPRMCALAEVLWSDKKNRNWNSFIKRMDTHYKRLRNHNINFCKGSYKVDIIPEYDSIKKSMFVTLNSEIYKAKIYFTTDSTNPNIDSEIYKKPIKINKSTIIKACIFEENKLKEKVSEKKLIFHKAIGGKIKYLVKYNDKYPGKGITNPIDGFKGSDNYRDGYWQGYKGDDMDLIIDLGEITPVKYISASFFQRQKSWIFFPLYVEYSFSDDGKIFNNKKTIKNNIPLKKEGYLIKDFTANVDKIKTRYICIKAKNINKCPG